MALNCCELVVTEPGATAIPSSVTAPPATRSRDPAVPERVTAQLRSWLVSVAVPAATNCELVPVPDDRESVMPLPAVKACAAAVNVDVTCITNDVIA